MATESGSIGSGAQFRMRVLCLNNHSDMLGGSEAVFRETSELLRSRGHEVMEFTAFGQSEFVGDNEVCLGKSGIRKNLLSITDPFAARKLRRLIDSFQPDVAHSHIIYGGLTYSVVSELQSAAIPHVMSVHEYKLLCPVFTMIDGSNNICNRCATGEFRHAVLRNCKNGSRLHSAHSAIDSYVRKWRFDDLSSVDRFVFVSKFAKDLHVKYRPDLKGKSTHIYNPAPNTHTVTACDASTRNGFLYVGRLSAEKGLLTLVRAVSEVQGVNLTIVGDGPFRREVEQSVKSLRLDDRVTLKGFVPREKVPTYLSSHRFMVIPSEWYENNPMSLIEAFASGLPAIGAEIGGIPELVRNNATGRVFKPFDVEDLARQLRWGLEVSVETWIAMSDEARQFLVTNMDRQKYIDKILAVYGDVARM